MSDYVKIITKEKTYVVLQTMTKLQKTLPKIFIRCHRSYIINLEKVDALDDRVLEVGGHAIPVSRSYYNEIKNELQILS
jgi:DNA-binding LytR/AlgR family response regulator